MTSPREPAQPRRANDRGKALRKRSRDAVRAGVARAGDLQGNSALGLTASPLSARPLSAAVRRLR
jgi:hypothetical protein